MHPAGLLQPLSMSIQFWFEISINYIDGLLRSRGKTVLYVVVDRFSKAAHFIPIAHPYISVSVAHVFFDNIFWQHGLPESIVSDRDPIFYL